MTKQFLHTICPECQDSARFLDRYMWHFRKSKEKTSSGSSGGVRGGLETRNPSFLWLIFTGETWPPRPPPQSRYWKLTELVIIIFWIFALVFGTMDQSNVLLYISRGFDDKASADVKRHWLREISCFRDTEAGFCSVMDPKGTKLSLISCIF